MCTKPLKAWTIGRNPSGSAMLRITSWDTDHLQRLVNGSIVAVQVASNPDGLIPAPALITTSSIATEVITHYVPIPCGKCLECLKQRGQEWTNRCILEHLSHGPDTCYFVTLTYRDEALPKTYYDDPDTGEAYPAYTLSVRDVQLFLKRLRKRLFGNSGGTLRYYVAGEYGPSTLRPHYHALIFGAPGLTLNPTPHPTYMHSPDIEAVWPHGHHQINVMTDDTIAYACHYVTGKLHADNYALYDDHNMTRPFARMSRNPALGRAYYDCNDIFADVDNQPLLTLNVSRETGGLRMPVPAYFWRLYASSADPDHLKSLKIHRANVARDRVLTTMANTNLTYPEVLAAKERQAHHRYDKMTRRTDNV